MKDLKAVVKNSKNVQVVKVAEKTKTNTKTEKTDIFEQMKKGPQTEEVKKAVQEVRTKTETLIKSFRPSAEERIKNMAKFQILTNKYDKLKEKKEELEKFKISSDGTQEKIYFENSQGFKLEVSNSNIIEEMLKLAENTLAKILGDTEEQVQNFII